MNMLARAKHGLYGGAAFVYRGAKIPKLSPHTCGFYFEFRRCLSSQSMDKYGLVLSGIQPTGIPTIGNYIGAIQNWVALQDRCDKAIYSVVDLHSITVPQDPDTLRQNIRDMAISLIACGINPDKSIIFQQSRVTQHAELAWILSCLTPSGILNKMTQWKSKSQRAGQCLGLFSYPVLMAADILVYRATHVPVGDDQTQHLELTRDIAGLFNNRYKTDFLVQPNALYTPFKRVMSLRAPDAKMSKSDPHDGSRINLTDMPDEIRGKIRKAVTDSEAGIIYDRDRRPGVANLVDIAAAMLDETPEQVTATCSGMNKQQFKEWVSDVVIEKLNPIREEIERLRADGGYVDHVLHKGAADARYIAVKNMHEIMRLVGLS